MDDDVKKDVAIFRFSIISELVGGRKLSRGEKEEILREKCAYVWDIPGSVRTRISRSTILSWVRRYESSGRKLESLLPSEREDKGTSRVIDDDISLTLCNLKKKYQGASLPVIFRMAKQENVLPADFKASRATIYRLWKKEGLTDKKETQTDRRRFEAEFSNDLWQSDCMYGLKIEVEGKLRRTYLFAIIDDHSRLLVHAEFYLSQNLDCYVDCIKKACAKRGIPKKLYVDNGPAFRSRELSYGAASLGCALIHAKPYQPQGKGKIERWFKTVRMQFLPLCNKISSLDELNSKLFDWINFDYNARVHSATGQPPIKRYFDHIHLIREAPKEMSDYFRKRVSRKVDKDRTVTLLKRAYEAPVELIGCTVTLHYHSSDPVRVEVFYHNKSYGMLVPVDVNVNSRIRRHEHVMEVVSKDDDEKINNNSYKTGKLF